ncbi:MAG: hypothetical protein WC731_02135 [Candidatus Omnitrophota bacterium]|jgi:hypothetical protein
MTSEKKISMRQMKKDLAVVIKANISEMRTRFDVVTSCLREAGDEIEQKTAGEIWKRLREVSPKPITTSDTLKSLDTKNRAPALKDGKIEFADFYAYVKSFKKDVRPEKVIGLFTKEFAGLVATKAPLTLYPAATDKIHEVLEFLK